MICKNFYLINRNPTTFLESPSSESCQLLNKSFNLVNVSSILLNKIDCFVGVWCNDSTAGFELASGGLIPPTPAKQKCILQSVLLFGQTIS